MLMHAYQCKDYPKYCLDTVDKVLEVSTHLLTIKYSRAESVDQLFLRRYIEASDVAT